MDVCKNDDDFRRDCWIDEKRRKKKEAKSMVYTWYEKSAEIPHLASVQWCRSIVRKKIQRIRMEIWLESRLQTYRLRKSSSLLLSFLSSFTTPNHGPSAQHRRLYYIYIIYISIYIYIYIHRFVNLHFIVIDVKSLRVVHHSPVEDVLVRNRFFTLSFERSDPPSLRGSRVSRAYERRKKKNERKEKEAFAYTKLSRVIALNVSRTGGPPISRDFRRILNE
ncbi:hypothetical protein K0M31_011239 [Melipona bicolor]|uniref:Transmembrane protein n=1 Tax=Melipona bicolor TaxID=60889 RepID=A0AA40G950_9HYME|nr:hypothetical protein K0M31_011239 [Melipona bicolor]